MNPDASFYPSPDGGGEAHDKGNAMHHHAATVHPTEYAQAAEAPTAEAVPDLTIDTPATPEPAPIYPTPSQQTVLPPQPQPLLQPTMPTTSDSPLVSANNQPVPVVKVLSTRGVEYLFMSICLWIGAAGLIWALLSLVNGDTDAKALAFPATSIVVSGPIFALFFLRLKKAELNNPALRFDPSKRRTSQITQVVAFLTCLINVITFVYMIIASSFGEQIFSVGKSIKDLLVILVIAGGILAYYWFDEHRNYRA